MPATLLFLVSQWLCPSSIFSVNLFFIAPHPWQHLGFVSTLLPSVPLRGSLRGVVDCTVAHTAVIQCYWGCYNSVLCDQEPHSPGCCTSWQTTRVRRGTNESATPTGCDETNFLNLLYFWFFQAGCWMCVSQCLSPCGWVSPSVKNWRCRVTLTLNVISPPGIQNRQQSHVGTLAF